MGDKFSSGHDFDLSNAANSYVKVYNEHSYLNLEGDKSPKEVTAFALETDPANMIVYKDKPYGMYRIDVVLKIVTDTTTVSLTAYYYNAAGSQVDTWFNESCTVGYHQTSYLVCPV